ncbi:hypothetical protein ER308_18100 [Egibacter rhizosphaerae]|uniref:Uncharacterized protein n=1 Tax=Egibacter rhizosphaerae TaxID=1670831 RepID=A0A411YJ12_9ACTN|nr:hypothetical protein [Egibacter rhizosphaerae]QBI21295.1 hypothetical protein ER308_18100 [Egibacter rhizosphaerae]
MLFSEFYQITKGQEDDWFDTILDADTKLFIDPFLLYREDELPDSHWYGAHSGIIEHFQQVFELLALAGCDSKHLPYRVALGALSFREPREFCLGYTAEGTRGAGSAKGFAKLIAAAMCDAIRRGRKELRHFEELGVLHEGIGPDRISDMACTVLKSKFLSYTQTVARRHGLQLDTHKLPNASFDNEAYSWRSDSVWLPTNPYSSGPLLLTPARFLNDLPTLNADDWWAAQEAHELRDRFNLDVVRRVDKKTIVDLANRDPAAVEAWAKRRESERARPYDLRRDANGVYRWDIESRKYAEENPISLADPETHEQFLDVVEALIERFRHFVENDGGWRLLWDDRGPKPESAAQLLFRGLARTYCELHGINVDREVLLGDGAVDFKFSSGYEHRALLEVKKVENGKFWNGLNAQLPKYLEDDRCVDGWLLAVRFQGRGVSVQRVKNIPEAVDSVSQRLGMNIRYSLVDARRSPSASNMSTPK